MSVQGRKETERICLIGRGRARTVEGLQTSVVTALSVVGIVKVKGRRPIPAALERDSVSVPMTFFVRVEVGFEPPNMGLDRLLAHICEHFAKHSIALAKRAVTTADFVSTLDYSFITNGSLGVCVTIELRNAFFPETLLGTLCTLLEC